MSTELKDDTHSTGTFADKDGVFRRKPSVFRSWISSEPGAQFAPEKDRYILYSHWGCPWAHRVNIVRLLKGLEEIIPIVVLDYELFPQGWTFTGRLGTDSVDPIYGFKEHRQLYFKAEPTYTGRYTVPVLWDKKLGTIVNNESSDIIRIFFQAFDEFLPASKREVSHPNGGFLPSHLKSDIDALNDWIYNTVNNGVYKAGFATTQEPYDEAVRALFESLDRLEGILSDGRNYLFGEFFTEADIRLYTTVARFDVAYHTIFKCNIKMIRHDYPWLQRWYMRLYYGESAAFRETTHFDHIKLGYVASVKTKIVPLGPVPNIYPKGTEVPLLAG